MDEIRKMLEEYTGRELKPWHMPGHKRKPVFPGMWSEMFRRDVTEVPGTDDLHHATGAIRRSQEAAAEAVGAAYSHYLVGGSTAGILAAVSALTKLWREGREITGESPIFLVGANCHKSVWNGLRLVGAKTLLLEPSGDPVYGSVLADRLLSVLSEDVDDTGMVAGCILTSPTYAGAISPLGELHAVLQVYGIPMIVDEAHGAHLPFCSELEQESGVACGAEYVIQSLHKTLPALTQTAVLYVGGRRDEDDFEFTETDGYTPEILEEVIGEELAVFQSSSPSYLLMLSAEQAVSWAERNRDRFDSYIERMRSFREELARDLKQLELAELPGVQDPSRLMLRVKEKDRQEGKDEAALTTGTGMAKWLEEECGIVAELSGSRELILISTVCDEEADLDELKEALLKLDRAVKRERDRVRRSRAGRKKREEKHREEKRPSGEENSSGEGNHPSETSHPAGKIEDPREEGAVSASVQVLPQVGDFVQRDIYVYPPGVPILRSGERVTEAARKRLEEEQAAGRRIYGL